MTLREAGAVPRTGPLAELKRILFVAGYGRSGSTLLGQLFGSSLETVNIGEAIRFLFHKDMARLEQSCSCGRTAANCPFWGDIVILVSEDAKSWCSRNMRVRNMNRLVAGDIWQHERTAYEEVALQVRNVVSRILEKTGANTLVDTSKNPATGWLLGRVFGERLSVCHLVREPKNTVASWSRDKKYLKSQRWWASTAWWVMHNRAAGRLEEGAWTYCRVRYEDFISRPQATASAISKKCRIAEPEFLRPREFRVDEQHVLAGNPSKVLSGAVRIDRPARKASHQGALVACGIDLITFRLRKLYGYSGSDHEGVENMSTLKGGPDGY